MKKYLPYILYILIAVAVMRPFFGSGQLFLLDMVWGTDIRLSDYFSQGINSGLPVIFILKALNLVLSTAVIQKVLLLSIFFMAGAFMYNFVRAQKLPVSLAFPSGLFYMVNPYVYERFLAGHWYVLLGYAFFPLALKYFLAFLEKPDRKNFIKFTLLFSVYPMISLHWFYIAFLFFALCGLVRVCRAKQVKLIFSSITAKYLAGFSLIFIALNSFWLYSFFSASGVMQKITQNDFKAFQTDPDAQFGVFFNVLSLYGFWNKANFLPKDFFSLWPLFAVLVFALFIIGLIRSIKDKEIFGLIAAIAFMPVLFVAVGYAHPATREMINFLYYSLPGFKGLRETAKITGLLAFFYAYFMPLGLYGLAGLVIGEGNKNRKRFISVSTLIIAGAIPFLITFGMFNSFNRQVRAYSYPAGWQKAGEILAGDPSAQKILFLPWHGYPRLDFAGNVKAANPAKAYFGPDIITGKNLDNVFLLETEQGEWDGLMFRLVQGVGSIDENLEFLKNRQVSYIILAKIDDWDRYSFLNDSTALENVFEDDSIVLFKVVKL